MVLPWISIRFTGILPFPSYPPVLLLNPSAQKRGCLFNRKKHILVIFLSLGHWFVVSKGSVHDYLAPRNGIVYGHGGGKLFTMWQPESRQGQAKDTLAKDIPQGSTASN